MIDTQNNSSATERKRALIQGSLDKRGIGPGIHRIPKADRSGPLPLSFAQQRLWFLDQLEPTNSSYNMPSALRFGGDLDVAALERTIDEVIRRHEALRTHFEVLDGQPIQVIEPPRAFTLPVSDLTDVSPEERDRSARALSLENAFGPFDLSHGPLIRAHLVRLGAQDHILLFTLHHIVSDGRSTGILVREVSALYHAYSSGLPSPLPELGIQYADYAVWQRSWLRGDVLETQLSYWREQLTDMQALDLPTDYPRPAIPSHSGAFAPVSLSAELTAGLKQMSQREGVTIFMTVLSAFSILLSLYSGQKDIAVGSPIANRTHSQTEDVIGFFVNTLVLRVDLSGNPSVRRLLARVRKSCLGAYSRQDLPFEQLVERLAPARDLGRNPLVQVFLNVTTENGEQLHSPGLTIQGHPRESAIDSKFDISLYLASQNDRLAGSFCYNAELFNQDSIAMMSRTFTLLLERIVGSPDSSLADLVLPGSVVDQQPSPVSGARDAGGGAPESLVDCFERQLRSHEQDIAVKTPNYCWTYAELNSKANAIAAALRGITPVRAEPAATQEPSRVALLFNHDAPMIAAILGVLKAGLAYVPLAPDMAEGRLRAIVADSEPDVLLVGDVDTTIVDRLLLDGKSIVNLPAMPLLESSEAVNNVELSISPKQLAYVLYTSGSTGTPKGVMQSHENVLAHSRHYTRSLPIRDDDRLSLFSNYGFDASVMDIFGALLNGAALYPIDLGRMEVDRVREWLEAEAITVFHSTPTVFRYITSPTHGSHKFSSVRAVVLGGEEVYARDFEQYKACFSPDCLLINGLGPTESTVTLQYALDHSANLPWKTVPIGYPVADTQVLLLNDAHEITSVYGEIGIRSPYVALGYWKRPDLTAEALICVDGVDGPIYLTGDLARRLPNGALLYMGRKDQQVKVRGYRIELAEIETALLRLDSILSACVVAWKPDTDTQQGSDPVLAAYVVADEQLPKVSISELRKNLSEYLPAYMIPSSFDFLEQLPLTPNGKLDKKALPLPSLGDYLRGRGYVAPRSPLEELLCTIWGEVLGVDAVGVNDHFFELGGHSLLAIQVVANAKQRGLHFAVKDLMLHQTIEQLAPVVSDTVTVNCEQSTVVGPVPLTPRQVARLSRNMKSPDHWAATAIVRVGSQMDLELLDIAVRALAQHHDALRSRFYVVDGKWQSKILPAEPHTVFVYKDLTSVSKEEREQNIVQTARELRESLNLSEGPLYKVAYLSFGPSEDGRLLAVINHLVVDAHAMGILSKDLETAYRQLLDGHQIDLPTKSTSVKQWAERLAEHARSETVRSELPYWTSSARRNACSIPVDYENGSNTDGDTSTVLVCLTANETSALLRDTVQHQHRVSVKDVLLAATANAFSHWVKGDSMIVDWMVHGREQIFSGIDLSRTVGLFSMEIPLVLHLHKARSVAQALSAIQELRRNLPQNGLGYGLLRYMSDEATSGLFVENSLAQVSFNYVGSTDQYFATSSLFGRAYESKGARMDVNESRRYLIQLTSFIADSRLSISWKFSTKLHAKATIVGIADQQIRAIRQLIHPSC